MGSGSSLTVAGLDLGTHSIKAHYSGDANFLPSTGTLSGTGFDGQVVYRPASSLNLATRLEIRTDDDVMIGGFIITGIVPKKVIVRGIGPSLAAAPVNIQSPLADPIVELHGPDGSLIRTNDNWKQSQEGAIVASGLAPKDNKEAAIIATLGPGNYTAVLRGANNSTGVGLVEVYDLDAEAASDLRNVSTRGFVGTGEIVMIGGFQFGRNQGPATILFRARAKPGVGGYRTALIEIYPLSLAE